MNFHQRNLDYYDCNIAMNVDWAFIKNYQEFEQLIRTLLLLDGLEIVPISREGRDASQDVLSQDGETVYQCKHHRLDESNSVIQDAKSEFNKIKKYKEKTHSNYKLWERVNVWVMVTNEPLNPNNHAKWKETIEPLFGSVGLKAEYMERAHVEALLVKHPEAYRSFFENETRCFLSLPEFESQYESDEHFLDRVSLQPYVGRAEYFQKIDEFIDSQKTISLVTGPGGVGKTRMLLEAGQRLSDKGSHQVFWANIESLEASTNWFSAIIQSKPTLLIVDEPDSEKLVKLLVEQIGRKGSRTENWKMLVSAKSPNDPVIKLIESPKVKKHVFSFQLEPLVKDSVLELSRNLIDSGDLNVKPDEWKISASKMLSNNFDGFPIWIYLAVSLLESHGNLSEIPENSKDLCDSYLKEIYTKQDSFEPDDIKSTLSFIALMGRLNRQEESQIGWLQAKVGYKDRDKLEHLILELIRRKIIGERGAYKRYLLVIPDVVRDRLIRDWLLLQDQSGKGSYKISHKAKGILNEILSRIKTNAVTQIDPLIIESIFRMELFLSFDDEPLHFTNYFFSELESDLPNLNTTAKIAAISLVDNIANYAPSGTIRFAKCVFYGNTEPETVKGIFADKLVTHAQVQEELIEPVYNAMLSAALPEDMHKGIELLSELANLDADRLSNRRRSTAADKLRGLIEGGPHVRSDFAPIALEQSNAILDLVKARSPERGEAEIYSEIFHTLTTHKRKQIWGEGGNIVFRTAFLHEDSERFQIRGNLVDVAKKYLQMSDVNTDTRLLLWKNIREMHFDSFQYLRRIKRELDEQKNKDKSEEEEDKNTVYIDNKLPQSILKNSQNIMNRLEKEVLDNLEWILKLTEQREISIKEHKGIRNIWQWHVEHDEDQDRISLCEQIKAKYLEDGSAKEFEFIESDRFRIDDRDESLKKAQSIVEDSNDSINKFIERAIEFYGDDSVRTIGPIVYYIGEKAWKDDTVLNYISEVLTNGDDVRIKLAINAARGLIGALRNEDIKSAVDTLDGLVKNAGKDSTSIQLVYSIYGTPYQVEPEKLSEIEVGYIRSHEELFAICDRSDMFVACVCWGVNHDYDNYKIIISRNIDRSEKDAVNQAAIQCFITGIFWWLKNGGRLPKEFNTWFLDQLFKLENLPHGTYLSGYEVEEILSVVGRAPIGWLVKMLNQRADKEKEDGGFKALNGDIEFDELVELIDEGNKDGQHTKSSLKELFELFKDQGTVGYYIPRIVHSLDSDGILLPSLYAEFTGDQTEFAHLASWVELCSKYEFNSGEWRIMCRALLKEFNKQDRKRKPRFYRMIVDKGSEIYQYEPGSVPRRFYKDVEDAQKYSEHETDPAFRDFWIWYLERANIRLQQEIEDAKEMRGE